MIDEAAIVEAVELQRRCHRLLRWVTERLEQGLVQFDHVHEVASAAEAAVDWIGRHHDRLPEDARPAEPRGAAFRRFACCFASFLEVSYELVREPGERLYTTDSGCWCDLCAFLGSAPHLQPKKVRAVDKHRADVLMEECVAAVAAEEGRPHDPEAIARYLAYPGVAPRDVALVTYGVELIRRCDGLPSGPEALALWRRFAWKPSGSPIPGFELRADEILKALGRLRRQIRAAGQ